MHSMNQQEGISERGNLKSMKVSKIGSIVDFHLQSHHGNIDDKYSDLPPA